MAGSRRLRCLRGLTGSLTRTRPGWGTCSRRHTFRSPGSGTTAEKHRRKQATWLQPCPVTDHGEADDVWIPKIAAYGAAILTRDECIATRLLEHEAVRLSGARMLAITSSGSLSLWELVQVVAARWAWLEEKRQQPGPVIYGFTRTTDHVVRSW